jgi:hypothetical protein
MAVIVLLALLGGAFYYWFVYRPQQAEGGPVAVEEAADISAEDTAGEDTAAEDTAAEDTAADDSAEPKLHERIKANYGKKLQDRVKDLQK